MADMELDNLSLAALKKLAESVGKAIHRASFHSIERIAPSNRGIKHLWTYNNERPNMGIGGITPARDN